MSRRRRRRRKRASQWTKSIVGNWDAEGRSGNLTFPTRALKGKGREEEEETRAKLDFDLSISRGRRREEEREESIFLCSARRGRSGGVGAE